MRRPFPVFAGFTPGLLAAVALTAPVIPSPTAAQQTLQPGDEVVGSLTPGDFVDEAGAYYDVFHIPGRTPGLLSVTAEADELDTFLQVGIVVGGEFAAMLTNDDFPGLTRATDSRIYMEGDNDWTWEVRVSTYFVGGQGEYRVRVEALPGGEPVPQSTEYGADIEGALEESDGFAYQSFQDWYRFHGSEGDRIKVVLEAEFDGYLILRPVGGARLAEDDNSFVGTDAYLEVGLPEDGEYEVVVRSRVADLGSYRLRLGPDLDVTPPVADEGPVVQASGADEALPLDEWVDGSLVETDARDNEGRVFDGFYAPTGVSGVFAVRVESAVFEAEVEAGPSAQGRYTGLLTARGTSGAGGGTLLHLGLQQGQVFEIRVRSALGDAAGPYRIRIDPVEVGDGEPVEVGMGADLTGELGEGDAYVFGTFLDRYHFAGVAGDTVEVAVEGSFDPYVAMGMVGGAGLAQADDSPDGVGAWIGLVLPTTGVYEIQVGAARPGIGPYRLRVGRDLRPEPAPASGAIPRVPLTLAEREALARDGDVYRNALLGFEFPAPSPTIELISSRAPQEQEPDLHTWYLSEEDGSRQLMVIAHRTAPGSDAQRMAGFVNGLLGTLPFEVTGRSPAWGETGSADFVLQARNGARADLRCQWGGPTDDPGLLVCLLGTALEGVSLGEALTGLRVR